MKRESWAGRPWVLGRQIWWKFYHFICHQIVWFSKFGEHFVTFFLISDPRAHTSYYEERELGCPALSLKREILGRQWGLGSRTDWADFYPTFKESRNWNDFRIPVYLSQPENNSCPWTPKKKFIKNFFIMRDQSSKILDTNLSPDLLFFKIWFCLFCNLLPNENWANHNFHPYHKWYGWKFKWHKRGQKTFLKKRYMFNSTKI